ncbi:protein DpdD [Actinokineospora pegani]|uniref:protein DpdD n=1 Tax=Actinokineospora pegani TaxID=2654637 RepID=UPI0022A77E9A|nr:protein DpdD [Actinokineospora pegani]
MSPTPDAEWSAFLEGFFADPNELRPHGSRSLRDLIDEARQAWFSDPQRPMFLPLRASSYTYWYAIFPDRSQQPWVRDLVRAHVGSWISTQVAVEGDSTTAVDAPVRALIGDQGAAFRFLVARHADAVSMTRDSIARLVRTLAQRPHRKVRLLPPLGMVLGDFADACASGAQSLAASHLDRLEQDHRLSKTNKLFLRLRYLAVFECWQELADLPEFPDLLRLDRPAAASDALARYAMARVPLDADLAAFAEQTPEFGNLVPSVTAIRSAAGAQYYAFWSVASGERSSAVSARLAEAGWLDHATDRPGLALILGGGPDQDPTATVEVDPQVLHDAVARGRFDAAIELLSASKPTTHLLEVLTEVLLSTFHPQAIALFQRWKSVLGPDEATVALTARGTPSVARKSAELATADFGAALRQAFTDSNAVQRAEAFEELKEHSIARLMRPGVLADVLAVVRSLSGDIDQSLRPELVDLLLDIERDLYAASKNVPGIQDLRVLVIETWALNDATGDRRRVERVIDLVARTLASGLGTETYSDVVDGLILAWAPFQTSADLELGLEAVEVLAAWRPDSDSHLLEFAVPIISRIGVHNASNLGPSWLQTAVRLGTDFGLDLTGLLVPFDSATDGDDALRVPSGTVIAIYSLIEPAARRAADVLKATFAHIRVDVLSDKVATEALRTASRTADVMVIADKAAAHAATDAIKAARGTKPLAYARGKGTASLLDAVYQELASAFARI